MRELAQAMLCFEPPIVRHIGASLRGKGDKGKAKAKGKAAIDPNAPAGGGGPGRFKDPSCLNGPAGATAKCAPAPAARHAAPRADALKPGAQAPPQPPPATRATKTLLKKASTAIQDIEVYIEVLEDTTNPNLDTGSAKTSFGFENVQSAVPGYETMNNKITKFDGKFELKGTITIQTAYGPGAKATDLSGYGRGTTAEDERNGNVTLGFHESRHREDFQKYLQNHPIPEAALHVGMTAEQYNADSEKFSAAFNKYGPAVEAYSNTQTDEVGYPSSKYHKNGPRSK